MTDNNKLELLENEELQHQLEL